MMEQLFTHKEEGDGENRRRKEPGGEFGSVIPAQAGIQFCLPGFRVAVCGLARNDVLPNQTVREWHSRSVTLSETKGLSERFFAEFILSEVEGLRMTYLRDRGVKCTHVPQSNLVAVVRLVINVCVEEVVGRVRHQRFLADVVCHSTAGRRCNPSRGVQPLDEGGCREIVATGRTVLSAHYLKQEPGNRTRRDGGGSGGNWRGPDGAGVLGVLPRRAGRATLHGVGAEEVGEDLLTILLKYRGLRPEECPSETRSGKLADVLLGACSVSFEEHLVSRWHL